MTWWRMRRSTSFSQSVHRDKLPNRTLLRLVVVSFIRRAWKLRKSIEFYTKSVDVLFQSYIDSWKSLIDESLATRNRFHREISNYHQSKSKGCWWCKGCLRSLEKTTGTEVCMKRWYIPFSSSEQLQNFWKRLWKIKNSNIFCCNAISHQHLASTLILKHFRRPRQTPWRKSKQ